MEISLGYDRWGPSHVPNAFPAKDRNLLLNEDQGPQSRIDRAATFTATVALVLGLAARFLVLASDPAYDLWAGYVTDEGRWTEQARSLVLFGQTDLTSVLSRMHLLLAPLFQAA